MLDNYFFNTCDIGNTCPEPDGSTGGAPGSPLAETPSFTLGNAPRSGRKPSMFSTIRSLAVPILTSEAVLSVRLVIWPNQFVNCNWG